MLTRNPKLIGGEGFLPFFGSFFYPMSGFRIAVSSVLNNFIPVEHSMILLFNSI
jgi:hypothetical protein